jgi:hypothetical protein
MSNWIGKLPPTNGSKKRNVENDPCWNGRQGNSEEILRASLHEIRERQVDLKVASNEDGYQSREQSGSGSG